MFIVKKPKQLTEFVARTRAQQRKIGYVPTMGALHDGHLSLIRSARAASDLTVCSIFVNPTQFNNPDDYKHYPITIETDIEKLVAAGCDVLFLPGVNDMYPSGFAAKHYELGHLETVLEGKYRPGHFQGVCQVVDRLLEIVQPDDLFMGQKDFQQCMVIQKLLELTHRQQVHLHILPTRREPDGLAMSSRNLRLDADQRSTATEIYRSLQAIRDQVQSSPFPELEQQARVRLERSGFAVDYVEIAKARDLSAPEGSKTPLVALIAASLGNIRLIDNLLLN